MPDQEKIATLLHQNNIKEALSEVSNVKSVVVIWEEEDNGSFFMVSNLTNQSKVYGLLERAMKSLITILIGKKIEG